MIRGKKTASLVESQARFHEIQKSLSMDCRMAVEQAGPWLTISRQVGSGGTEVARLLGLMLGWKVYDRELISEVAQRIEAPESVLSQRDEQATSKVDGYLSFFRSTVDPGQVRFQYEMREAIGEIAERGEAVILGRGANWVVHKGCGLRVRVIAPVEQRIERLAERESLALAEARRRVTEIDAGQRAFILQAYAAEIDDAAGYDLVISTGRLGPEAVAGLIAGFVGQMLPDREDG